jgi:hypothetical protein
LRKAWEEEIWPAIVSPQKWAMRTCQRNLFVRLSLV